MKTFNKQLIAVVLIPIVIAAMEPGSFDGNKAFMYFMVSFITFGVVIGIEHSVKDK